MGASDFWTPARGKTAQEAFNNAVDEARYEHGHGGYTGTIAEKHSFRMVPVPSDKTAVQYSHELMNDFDNRGFWWDKWGDAACINNGEGSWIFFGMASS